MARQNRVQKFLTPQRRKILSRLWIVGVLLYDAGRALIINHTLSRYGVNGVHYFIFEVGVSIPYSIVSLKLILAFVDKKVHAISIYATLTAILFFAPDVYIFVISDHMPHRVYIVLISVLCVTTTISVFSLLKQYKKSHSKKAEEKPSPL